jgi:hypothetical protein
MSEDQQRIEDSVMKNTMAGSQGIFESNPMENMRDFADLMLEKDEIPGDIAKDWWGFLNNDNVLTRSSSVEDRQRAMNHFHIMENIRMMSMPHYKVDIESIKTNMNVQKRFFDRQSRSIDGFERTALTTQVREIKTTPTPQKSGSFLKGIAKKFGLGGGSDDDD